MTPPKLYAIIAGAGSGTGASLARKFAQTYTTILIARKESTIGPLVSEINANPHTSNRAIGLTADLSSATSLAAAFASLKAQLPPDALLAAAVFNASGGHARKPFLELTREEFTAGWEGNGLGLYNFAQLALPLLLQAVESGQTLYPPTLLLTGATASVRGSALFGSFAVGKFGVRALGQSLAREFHPKGVHVAHVIVDGGIDTPWGKERVVNGGAVDGKLSPDGMADTYWSLHTQPRSVFTQEIDMRPFIEKF